MHKEVLLIRTVLLLGIGGIFQGCTGLHRAAIPPGGMCSGQPEWGEYGTSLNLLRFFYTPPQTPDESNYFIDMEGGESLRKFAFSYGLTNNHALFVFLHGRAIETPSGLRYSFYADQEDNPAASFSIQDIARILGPENVSQIHNLVLASCNR